MSAFSPLKKRKKVSSLGAAKSASNVANIFSCVLNQEMSPPPNFQDPGLMRVVKEHVWKKNRSEFLAMRSAYLENTTLEEWLTRMESNMREQCQQPARLGVPYTELVEEHAGIPAPPVPPVSDWDLWRCPLQSAPTEDSKRCPQCNDIFHKLVDDKTCWWCVQKNLIDAFIRRMRAAVSASGHAPETPMSVVFRFDFIHAITPTADTFGNIVAPLPLLHTIDVNEEDFMFGRQGTRDDRYHLYALDPMCDQVVGCFPKTAWSRKSEDIRMCILMIQHGFHAVRQSYQLTRSQMAAQKLHWDVIRAAFNTIRCIYAKHGFAAREIEQFDEMDMGKHSFRCGAWMPSLGHLRIECMMKRMVFCDDEETLASPDVLGRLFRTK